VECNDESIRRGGVDYELVNSLIHEALNYVSGEKQIFSIETPSGPQITKAGCRALCQQEWRDGIRYRIKWKSGLSALAYEACQNCRCPFRVCPICWYVNRETVPSYFGKNDLGVGFCAACTQRIAPKYGGKPMSPIITEQKVYLENLGENIVERSTIVKTDRTMVYVLCIDTSRIDMMITDILGNVAAWQLQISKGFNKISEFMSMANNDPNGVVLAEAAIIKKSTLLQSWIKSRKGITFIVGNKSDNGLNSLKVVQPLAEKDCHLPYIMAPFKYSEFAKAIEEAKMMTAKTSACDCGDNISLSESLPENKSEDVEENKPSPSPVQDKFILVKKACILCSNTEIWPALQSILEELGFTCEIVKNLGELKEQVRQVHSFVFVFASDASDQVKDFVITQNPERRCFIIGNKNGNFSNNIDATRSLRQKLGCRRIIVFPFEQDVVKKALDLRHGETWSEPVEPVIILPVPEPALQLSKNEEADFVPENLPEPIAEEKTTEGNFNQSTNVDADPIPLIVDNISKEQPDERPTKNNHQPIAEVSNQKGGKVLAQLTLETNGDLNLCFKAGFLSLFLPQISAALNSLTPTPINDKPSGNGKVKSERNVTETEKPKSKGRFSDTPRSRLPEKLIAKKHGGRHHCNTETVDDSKAVSDFLKPFSIGNSDLESFLRFVKIVYLSAAFKENGNSAGTNTRRCLGMNRNSSDEKWVSNNVNLLDIRLHDSSADPQIVLPLQYPLVALLNSAEVILIKEKLEEKNGNIASAARALQISERKLLKLMEGYGIEMSFSKAI